MVDINLLGDEDSSQNISKGDFDASEDFEESRVKNDAENSQESSWEDTEEIADEYDEDSYESSKSRAPWIVLLVLIVIAVVVAVYVWRPYLRKSDVGESPAISEAETDDAAVVDQGQEDSPAIEPAVISSEEAAGQDNSLRRIEYITSAVSLSGTMRSFSYSTGKFYLEIDSPQKDNLQDFHSEVQRLLPGSKVGIRIRSSDVDGGMHRALVSGEMDKEGDASFLGRTVSANDFKRTVNALCEANGLSLIRIGSNAQVRDGATIRTPVRVVVRGDQLFLVRFLQNLANEAIAMQFTRILMVPSRGGSRQKDVLELTAHIDLL